MGGNMRLRNKKTGGLANLVGDDFFRVRTDAGWADYNSLAELNEEWEDYKPTEPLIKDEKVRKAVRAWADVVGTNKCTYDRFWETFRSMDTAISFAGVYEFELEDEENYTIAELCGEKEE